MSELHSNKWFQFDINYSPNDIKIVGITDYDTSMSLPSPEYYGFKDWIPEDVDFISKNIFHIQTDSLNHHLAFKSLELKFRDLIQEKEHEILILESQSENLGFNELSKLFFLDTLKFSKLENDFSVIDSNLLKSYFPHITFKNRYGFQIDQFLLIANLEAKKEFDYKLSQINSDDFNPAIFSENKNSEFDQEHSHFSYKSQPELLKKITYVMLYILSTIDDPNEKFKPYYDILPTVMDNFPLFWEEEELDLLQGSQFLDMISRRKKSISEDYNTICKVIPELEERFSEDDFMWCRTIVGSRNFGLNIHGHDATAMVPLADMLNHFRPAETKWFFDNTKNGVVYIDTI